VFEPSESKRKQRPVTVLAILFGLLVGLSGGTPTRFDSSTARLGNGEILRTAAGLRGGARSGEDRPDRDDATALLPSAPRIVTELVSVRPATPAVAAIGRSASLDPQFHYRARAPPAA
jgi:hypothetical protein